MNNSKTESDYKIIRNKLDFMEQILDNTSSYPTAKQVQAQQKNYSMI